MWRIPGRNKCRRLLGSANWGEGAPLPLDRQDGEVGKGTPKSSNLKLILTKVFQGGAEFELLRTPSAPSVGSADPPGEGVSTTRPLGHGTQWSQGALPLTRDPGELSTAPGTVLSSSPEPRVPVYLLLSLGGPGQAA